MEKKYTYEHFEGLKLNAQNIKNLYRLLHPEGLTLDELRQKAEQHTFYRILYHHLKDRGES